MGCSVKYQKIQAMKNYKREKFVYNFVLYSLTSLVTCFFFPYPFCFPSIKHLISYDLPNNISFLFNSKCFFIVGNLIILFLVGESKLKGPSQSSPASDIYDEYVARSRNSPSHQVNSKEINGFIPSLKIQEEKHGNDEKDQREKKKEKEMRVCKSSMRNEEKKEGMRACKSEVWAESEIVKWEKTKGKEDLEKLYIPREELNQRVEAFIARVKKQRMLAAT